MENNKSIWKDFVKGLQEVSHKTLETLMFVYDKGDEHKHYLIPALNGIIGDKLDAENNKLAIQMSFRKDNQDINIESLSLMESLKRSGGNLVIFVHGLMADEVLWIEPSKGKKGYGPLLLEEKNQSILYLRYNTGRHISENGKSLSTLMENLNTYYKDNINCITIVAHSMGGLVSRSSCYYAKLFNHTWITKIKNIYLIGVPHDGAFLEKIGHLTTVILKNIWNFQTKLIAKIAEERSNGIKDLRWGFMVDEDWQSPNANALMNVKRKTVPPLEGVKYHIIVGTLLENEMNVVSQYFGDGLVGKKSASGEIFSTSDDSNPDFLEFRVFSKIHHISLLTHSEVYQYISETI